MEKDILTIGTVKFRSRLFIGTGKFGSMSQMKAAVLASESELVTVALKRVEIHKKNDDLLAYLKHPHIHLLPNTSGARSCEEALFLAQLGREALETDLVKLEIHPDQKYLMPDPIETLKATEALVKSGFVVMPYVHADPVLCKRLEEVGASCVMPLGAPIGSNMGLKTFEFLKIIVEQCAVPVIVDAGIGLPSQAAAAMELGADAVLVNTAIATAEDPVAMAMAFKTAVMAGSVAYKAKAAAPVPQAISSSPLTSFLYD